MQKWDSREPEETFWANDQGRASCNQRNDSRNGINTRSIVLRRVDRMLEEEKDGW